ncbi:hypothetical protein, partial [Escherichia coli]|uniref:hypothetical protein n=1 Tax=Escherichia coli TaxID=562 RepID=UPI001436AD15
FSDKEFLDKWSEVNGYPKLTPENLTEIRRLADLVQKAPDGREKYRAMEDLLRYQSDIKGVNMRELMTSVWYAHVLSGYNTQLIN